MNAIAYVKKCILSTRWRLLWYKEFIAVKKKKLVPSNLIPLDINSSDSILIIAPHADDEWIGCYSILKTKHANITCCYMNMYGDDYSETNIQTRTLEIIKSSKYWGFDLRIVKNNAVEFIKECVKGKSICFIPSPYDWHPEHRKAFCQFYESYSQLSDSEKSDIRVYYYSISVPHSDKEKLSYITLTKDELNQKWNVFNTIYASQSFMPSHRYKLQLRLVPRNIGYAAQLFICANDERLQNDYNLINNPYIEEKLNDSSHYIYNILKSREIVNNIFYAK